MNHTTEARERQKRRRTKLAADGVTIGDDHALTWLWQIETQYDGSLTELATQIGVALGETSRFMSGRRPISTRFVQQIITGLNLDTTLADVQARHPVGYAHSHTVTRSDSESYAAQARQRQERRRAALAADGIIIPADHVINRLWAIEAQYDGSFTEFADQIGIRKTFLSRYLSGRRHIPPRVAEQIITNSGVTTPLADEWMQQPIDDRAAARSVGSATRATDRRASQPVDHAAKARKRQERRRTKLADGVTIGDDHAVTWLWRIETEYNGSLTELATQIGVGLRDTSRFMSGRHSVPTRFIQQLIAGLNLDTTLADVQARHPVGYARTHAEVTELALAARRAGVSHIDHAARARQRQNQRRTKLAADGVTIGPNHALTWLWTVETGYNGSLRRLATQIGVSKNMLRRRLDGQQPVSTAFVRRLIKGLKLPTTLSDVQTRYPVGYALTRAKTSHKPAAKARQKRRRAALTPTKGSRRSTRTRVGTSNIDHAAQARRRQEQRRAKLAADGVTIGDDHALTWLWQIEAQYPGSQAALARRVAVPTPTMNGYLTGRIPISAQLVSQIINRLELPTTLAQIQTQHPAGIVSGRGNASRMKPCDKEAFIEAPGTGRHRSWKRDSSLIIMGDALPVELLLDAKKVGQLRVYVRATALPTLDRDPITAVRRLSKAVPQIESGQLTLRVIPEE